MVHGPDLGDTATTIRTTPRLRLRTFASADLPAYAALNADPAVYRMLGGGPLSRADSDALAARGNALYRRERMGLLAVERREDAAFLGMCGLHHHRWYPEEVEVGWRLAPRYWGQGYATEAAAGWLEEAFGSLGLARVISFTIAENHRSLAVMQRLGLRLDHVARMQEDGRVFEILVHAITRAAWATRSGEG